MNQLIQQQMEVTNLSKIPIYNNEHTSPFWFQAMEVKLRLARWSAEQERGAKPLPRSRQIKLQQVVFNLIPTHRN